MLFKIYRDYLASEGQRKKILKMQNEERRKRELKKQQQYNLDVFANKKTESIQKFELETGPELQQQSIHPVPYKESVFKKLLNRIRGFFKK